MGTLSDAEKARVQALCQMAFRAAQSMSLDLVVRLEYLDDHPPIDGRVVRMEGIMRGSNLPATYTPIVLHVRPEDSREVVRVALADLRRVR